MFDFGFSELLLVGVVALVVLGPERLPKVARTAGRWIGKLQSFSANMKNELNRQVEAASLNEVKSDIESAVRDVKQGWQEAGGQLQAEAEAVAQMASADLPAWERLPEQHTPADFGVDEHGNPLVQAEVYRPGSAWQWQEEGRATWHSVSLRRQALNRRRDMRPRHRPKPALRVRRHSQTF